MVAEDNRCVESMVYRHISGVVKMASQQGAQYDSSHARGTSAAGDAESLDRQISDACEEIPEDAYRQNYVYRAWRRGMAADDFA